MNTIQQQTPAPTERHGAVQAVLFNSRCLLAPFYVGLALALVLSLITFARLLLVQPPAADFAQRPALHGEVLVVGADAGVAEEQGISCLDIVQACPFSLSENLLSPAFHKDLPEKLNILDYCRRSRIVLSTSKLLRAVSE